MRRGVSLRVRFSRVTGETARGLLDRPMTLPAIIGEFSVDEEFVHRDYETHAAGEFSVPGQGGKDAPSLRRTDLETLTIDWEARWLAEWRPPEEVKRELLRLARSKTPFELAALLDQDGPEEVRFKATIRSRRTVLKPGEADTRYWTLEIKEWRKNRVSRRSAKIGRRGVHLPTKHRLTATDTLESLSDRYYEGPGDWRAIARANGIKRWGQTTPLIKHSRYKVGDFIKIPEAPDVIVSAAEEYERERARSGA